MNVPGGKDCFAVLSHCICGGRHEWCVPVTGLHSWLLLQVWEVLSPHPHSPTTGLHSHHILWNVNPRKKLQSSFCPQSCLPIHSVRGGCWGPKQDTKPQRFEHNNSHSLHHQLLSSPALSEFPVLQPWKTKKGLVGLLGLDLRVGSYVWYCQYSCGCQSSHKTVVFKRQEPMFWDKPYDTKLSG